MTTAAHHRLVKAIRGLGERQIEYKVNPPSYATVLSVSPLQVELQESGLRFDEDSIILSQEVLQYDLDYGIAAGDVLVVLQMVGDDLVAQAVLSPTEIVATESGADGSVWRNGTGVPSDSLGVNGDFYLNDANGNVYKKAADEYSLVANIKGATGAAGTNGTNGTNGADGADGYSVLSGSGAPAGGLGVNGNFYIDTTAHAVYGPKTGGAWGAATSMIGPKGDKGDKGDTGNTGATGPPGAGDVVGPASAVDSRIAVFDGTSGKLLKDGGVAVAGLNPSNLGMTGVQLPWGGRTAPAWGLLEYGQAVSRSTYAALFSVLVPLVGTCTISQASPAVVTLNGHGFVTGDQIVFTTTGALPAPLAANTLYYAIYVNANTFQLATTRALAHSGATKINTTNAGSGTHSCYACPYGLGDGSTTFNVPDKRGRTSFGADDMGGTSAGRLTGANIWGELGEAGGEEAHTLSATESGTTAHGHANTFATAATSHTHANTFATAATSHTHANTFAVGAEAAHTHPASHAGYSFMEGSVSTYKYPGTGTPAFNTSNYLGASTGAGSSHTHGITGSVTAEEAHVHAISGGVTAEEAHVHAISGGVTNATAAAAASAHNNIPNAQADNWIIVI